MSTETIDRPKADDGTGTDIPELFHYVLKSEMTRSAVEGTHVVALCGETFPVTRCAKTGSPKCPECQQIYETLAK